ncbi:CHAT domain-containing protein [bacterium]|nr:CHAT domain-containing protein [bacterium]
MRYRENDPNPVGNHNYTRVFLFLFAFLALILHPVLYPWGFIRNSFALDAEEPEDYMKQGLMSFYHGNFSKAIQNYSKAAVLYDGAGSSKDMCNALIQGARSYQYIGQYKKSLEILDKALCLSEKTGDVSQIALIFGSMGNASLYTGDVDKADAFLKRGLSIAEMEKDYQTAAFILNNIGNMYQFKGLFTYAITSYKNGIDYAGQAGNRQMIGHLLTNLALAFIKDGRYNEARKAIEEATDKYPEDETLMNLRFTKGDENTLICHSGESRNPGFTDENGAIFCNSMYDKASWLINIAQVCCGISKYLPEDSHRLKTQSYKALCNAARIAEHIKDHRLASYALGYLGRIYEDDGRLEEALHLTRMALFEAQQTDASESLCLWEWQTGRLFKAQGKTQDAILSYRNAVDTLQSVRNGVFAGCPVCAGHSFHETIEPLYFELADLLLQHASCIEGSKESGLYLAEAQETIELLKTAELRDYFQDPCLGYYQSKTISIASIDRDAAVVYIIPFPERLELLLGLPEGMKRFTSRVGRDELTKEACLFRSRLEKRTTREYLEQAQRLYDWLIRPFEGEIFSERIRTLIFVPDGAMRNIPMSALHDGKEFLISKCAIANTLGLNLTDPSPIKREAVCVLLAGITEPVQGFPALEGVGPEIQSINEIYDGKILLNHDLVIANIKRELDRLPYNIVHIASHGEFSGDASKTYILAWDGMITMDHLDHFMRLSQFRQKPVELLTLSACQTAAGDKMAALGLAGLAIKAGARSAVATLWHINDKACSDLIIEFYKQLRDPSVSKAKALRTSQLKLLEDERYDHPCYWSPFILIGNWL